MSKKVKKSDCKKLCDKYINKTDKYAKTKYPNDDNYHIINVYKDKKFLRQIPIKQFRDHGDLLGTNLDGILGNQVPDVLMKNKYGVEILFDQEKWNKDVLEYHEKGKLIEKDFRDELYKKYECTDYDMKDEVYAIAKKHKIDGGHEMIELLFEDLITFIKK